MYQHLYVLYLCKRILVPKETKNTSKNRSTHRYSCPKVLNVEPVDCFQPHKGSTSRNEVRGSHQATCQQILSTRKSVGSSSYRKIRRGKRLETPATGGSAKEMLEAAMSSQNEQDNPHDSNAIITRISCTQKMLTNKSPCKGQPMLARC